MKTAEYGPQSGMPKTDRNPGRTNLPGEAGRRLNWRPWILGFLVLGSLVTALVLPRIGQDPGYFNFADRREIAGVPNFWDVVTNVPFLFIGIAGVLWCGRRERSESRFAWLAMFAGIASIGPGSAYFHWNPNVDTLVWDRSSLACGFMGFFLAVLGERIDPRWGRVWVLPALALGVGSVLIGYVFDDLRLYGWVQFMPMLVLPLVLLLYPSRYTHGWIMGGALGVYALAKVAELLDGPFLALTGGLIAGHAVKHLLGAVACFMLLRMLIRRAPRAGALANVESQRWLR
ncbi:MAG: hypothetical protein AB7J34_19625 [Limisphaerales bacterium]